MQQPKPRLDQLRRDYRAAAFDEPNVDADPFAQFALWFDNASAAGEPEPNAMTVATADRAGIPNARILLLKAVRDGAFVFFSNYESQKGTELADNPGAALVFYWPSLERQVRVAGIVAMVDRRETDEYFASRPLGSRASAWASPQSQPIAGRRWLEDRVARVQTLTPGWADHAPPNWGGYALTPAWFEFWQGRPDRLHDRLRYRQEGDAWIIERLAP